MARKKRKSPALDKARLRLAGMKAIDPNLDLGDGFSVADVTTRISSFEVKLSTYNEHLSDLDDELNLLVTDEKTMEQANSVFFRKWDQSMVTTAVSMRWWEEFVTASGKSLRGRRQLLNLLHRGNGFKGFDAHETLFLFI